MNYYEHHLGDYLRDTAHLTILEDGAYRRLIDLYYTREERLPPSLEVICRLIRARTEDERGAVMVVLDEFFTRSDDGYSHKRCDEELAKYHASIPAADAKRENERERQRRARDRRKQLFSTIRELGHVAAWDSTTEELETYLSHITNGGCHAPVTRDNTATHLPSPNNHKEEEITVPSGDVVRVFDHWKTVHGKSRSRLDDKRKRLIRSALKSYPADDLCRAIDGYKRSPFHQGQNDRHTVYDSIETMLRDAKQIDAGLGYAGDGGEVVRWR